MALSFELAVRIRTFTIIAWLFTAIVSLTVFIDLTIGLNNGIINIPWTTWLTPLLIFVMTTLGAGLIFYALHRHIRRHQEERQILIKSPDTDL